MKVVVTVLGKDKPGIIAKVSTFLADNDINIEDINQTVMQGNFTMMMFCDTEKSKKSLNDLINEGKKLGETIGVNIHMQHEDVFNVMHKI